MSRTTYYIIGIIGTVVAFILDCALGGPLFTNPVAYIYIGFALTLSILYHVVNARPTHQPTNQQHQHFTRTDLLD